MTTTEAPTAGIKETFAAAPRAVKAIMLGIFVNQLGAFLNAFLVLFLTHRGFSLVQAGAALGVYGGGGVIGLLIGTAVSDRLGARRATMISMLGSAVLLITIRYTHNYAAILVVVGFTGVISLLYRPASAALVSELTPKSRQVMIFAMYRLALNLGTTVAPVLGALLIAVNYSLLFWTEAAVCTVYALLAAAVLPRHDAPAEDGTPAPRETKPPLSALFADRRYLVFLLAVFINAAVYVQYVSVLPISLKDAGYAIGWYSAMVSINGVIVITCELLMTKLVQRWPVKVVVALGFLLLAIGRALYALPWGIVVIIAGTLIWTLAEIVGGPSVFAYPGLAAPEGMRGRYLGAMQFAFGLGTALGPVIGLALYHVVGRSVWWIGGAVCLGAMACAWFSMRIPPSEDTVPEEVAAADVAGADLGARFDELTEIDTQIDSERDARRVAVTEGSE